MNSLVRPPDASPILVFDGECVLCNSTVRFVLSRARRHDIVFAAAQSSSGRTLLTRSGFDPQNPETFLFIENGRVLTRSDAAIALARHLHAPWRWLTALHVVPRFLRDIAYGWIARHRFEIFGRSASCIRPPPDQVARFLP